MSRILALARSITAEAVAYEQERINANLPEPSLGPDAPLDFPDTATELLKARDGLLSAIYEMEQAIKSPSERLRDFPHTCTGIGCVRALINFGIPEMVPLNTTISYADLSAGSGVGESVLRSIVRTAIASLGFLTELEPGQVGHSAVSAIYHRDKVTGDGERFIYNNLPISAIYLYESLKQDPSGQDENLSAFCSSHKDPQGNPENVWKYFKSHPEEGRHFMSAMKSVAAHPNRSAAHIVNSYDWSMLNGKLVVDCGGSAGHISAAVAKRYPEITFISQDLPEVISRAKNGPPLPLNVTLAEQSFFDPQPIAADAYLFRTIFHSWSDRSIERILQNLVPSLRNGSKLIVMDHVLAPPGAEPMAEERRNYQQAFIQNVLFNGKERDLGEFKDVIENFDKRFVFRKVVHPPGSTYGILEWEWVDKQKANGASERASKRLSQVTRT